MDSYYQSFSLPSSSSSPFTFSNSGFSSYGTGGPMNTAYKGLAVIGSNPFLFGAILVAIPVFALMIHGFVRRNINLGFTSLLLFMCVLLIAFMKHYKLGEKEHYVLLIVLILVAFGFMVYFATKVREKVGNNDYVNFYTPSSYKKSQPLKLSFYGLGGTDDLLKLMKGTEYGFALKEDMPIDLGTEFTYSFWLKICPSNFNKFNTKWRTIWYRGDSSSNEGNSIYKLKTPGVYLAPNTNKLIISVACENGPDEGNALTIDDIPLNEWFCVTITLEGRSLDCYINGLLEHSISLTGHPMMMNSNLVKGKMGYNGLMSFFRYSSGAMTPVDVKDWYDREKTTLEESNFRLETCPTISDKDLES